MFLNYDAGESGEDIGAWTDNEPPFILYFTLGNHGKSASNYNEGTEVDLIVIINSAFMLILAILYLFFDVFQTKKDCEIDNQELTPSDFTLLVSNIPSNIREEEFRSWLINKQCIHEKNIKEIIYCYNIRAVLDKRQEYLDAIEEANIIEDKLKAKVRVHPDNSDTTSESESGFVMPRILCCKQTTQLELDKARIRVSKLKQDLDNIVTLINQGYSSEGKFCGKAFVIFETQQQCIDLLDEFEVVGYKRVFFYVFVKLFKCKCYSSEKKKLNLKRILMSRAADPTDVYWINMPIKSSVRFGKTVLAYMIMIIVLGVSFALNLSLGLAKNFLESNSSKLISSEIFYAAFIVAISLSNGIVVSFINFVLGRIVRKVTLLERHETYTDYNLSVAIKLVIGLFINSGLIPFFINFGKDDWFTRTGLALDVTFITISINFVGPLFYMYPLGYFKTQYIIRRERKKETSSFTQRQMNALYEGQPLDIAQRHCNAMLLIMMSAFYSSLVPYIPIICFAGSVYQYWIEKYMLLRRHRIPERVGNNIEINFRVLLPLTIFLSALGQYLFIRKLSESENISIILPLYVSLGYCLIPIGPFLAKWIANTEVKRRPEDTYTVHHDSFFPNYSDKTLVSFIPDPNYYQGHASPMKRSMQRVRKIIDINQLFQRAEYQSMKTRVEVNYGFASKLKRAGTTIRFSKSLTEKTNTSFWRRAKTLTSLIKQKRENERNMLEEGKDFTNNRESEISIINRYEEDKRETGMPRLNISSLNKNRADRGKLNSERLRYDQNLNTTIETRHKLLTIEEENKIDLSQVYNEQESDTD